MDGVGQDFGTFGLDFLLLDFPSWARIQASMLANHNVALAIPKPCCKFTSANNKSLLLHNEWANPTQTILPPF
jgi:hypothetical protein